MARLQKQMHTSKSSQLSPAEEGKVLRYVGEIAEGKCKVRIAAVDGDIQCLRLKMARTLWHSTAVTTSQSHLFCVAGAGTEVTAAGVFSDVMRTLGWKLGV
ncbi:hypothetical protein O9993_07950 [Vibrio lentus]|nr:hypothetical protein [Vibrio lentus]